MIKKGLTGFDRKILRDQFPDLVIRPLHFSVTMLESLTVYCDQSASLPLPCKHMASPLPPCKQLAYLPPLMKSDRVSVFLRMISVNNISPRHSTFSSSVLQKMSDLPAPGPDLCTIQTTLCLNETTSSPIQKIPSFISVWV